ncbi:MAG: hypothetical protein IJD21_08905 [Oscillospiraceae bacterium]|nr:hypothetical protein [Oscillospiraceae bacterium]
MMAAMTHLGRSFDEKQRFLTGLFLGCTFVGLVGLICYFTLVTGSDLSPYAQGFYLGISAGLLIAGIIGCSRIKKLQHSEEARRKAEIEWNDEREATVNRTALLTAGMVLFYAIILAMLILAPIDQTMCLVLFVLEMVFLASYAISRLVWNRVL